MTDHDALTPTRPTRSLTEEVEELFNEVDKAVVEEISGSKTTEQEEQVICI